MEAIHSFFSGIYNHFAVLTGIAFILAILKITFPILMFFVKEITNRFFEKRSAKRLMEIGMPRERAEKAARNSWRPKEEESFASRLLEKIIQKFKRKKDL